MAAPETAHRWHGTIYTMHEQTKGCQLEDPTWDVMLQG